jgi:hypothetical protein
VFRRPQLLGARDLDDRTVVDGDDALAIPQPGQGAPDELEWIGAQIIDR